MLRATQLVGFGAGGSPSIGPPAGGDPEWANVVLLASWDGADAATSFTDESPAGHALTFASGAALSNAQSALGYTTSLAILTDADKVTAADHADWTPFSSDRCFETLVRFNAFAGSGDDNTILAQWGSGTATRGFILRYFDTGGTLDFIYRAGGSDRSVGGAWSPSTGVWYHVAADIDATGDIRVWAGPVGGSGSLIAGPTAITGTANDSNQSLAIGGRTDSGLPNNFEVQGWLQETRITHASRYASAFTPATAPFPRMAA